MCPLGRLESKCEDICVDDDDDEGRSGGNRRWGREDGIGSG